MSATIIKGRRLVNPASKRKRKLSPKQIAIFGTKRQKAALKNSRRRKRVGNISGILAVNRGRSKNGSRQRRAKRAAIKILGKRNYKAYKHLRMSPRKRRTNGKRRTKNVSLGINELKKLIGLKRRRNSGKKGKTKNMARTRNRKRTRTHNRRRRTYNPSRRRRTYNRRRRATNPVRRRTTNPVVRSYRRRRGVVHHRRRHNRSRNPIGGGTLGKVMGYIGGFALTALISSSLQSMSFIPTTGILGVVVTAGVGYGQGKLVGKLAKNSTLGNDMVVGGLAYAALQALKYFMPSLAIPGFSGMGLIGGSQFYVPQVPLAGNFGAFRQVGMAPMAAANASAAGMGMVRRGPRLR